MKKIMLSFVLGILVLGFAAAAISGMAVSVSEKETKAFSFNDRNYAVDVSESSTGADLAINGETVEDVQVGDTIMVDGAEVEVTGVRAPWLFRNGYKVDLKVKESSTGGRDKGDESSETKINDVNDINPGYWDYENYYSLGYLKPTNQPGGIYGPGLRILDGGTVSVARAQFSISGSNSSFVFNGDNFMVDAEESIFVTSEDSVQIAPEQDLFLAGKNLHLIPSEVGGVFVQGKSIFNGQIEFLVGNENQSNGYFQIEGLTNGVQHGMFSAQVNNNISSIYIYPKVLTLGHSNDDLETNVQFGDLEAPENWVHIIK